LKMLKKLFGGIKITYIDLLTFSVGIALYTGLVLTVDKLKNTSFQDIGIGYEWWIFFAMIIIINSENPLESAIKAFIFFLVSQPIIYLVQPNGVELFLRYYRLWAVPTALTFPMAFVGWYTKKENVFSGIILSPMLFLLAVHAVEYFTSKHIFSLIFCIAEIIILTFGVLKRNRDRVIANAIMILSILILYVYIIRVP